MAMSMYGTNSVLRPYVFMDVGIGEKVLRVDGLPTMPLSLVEYWWLIVSYFVSPLQLSIYINGFCYFQCLGCFKSRGCGLIQVDLSRTLYRSVDC